MAAVNRRVTYKLYPAAEQDGLLWQCPKRHCEVYNAALEERISTYQKAGKSIGFAAQCRSLPSQVDPVCGEKKSLGERTHVLPDGTVIGRDQAAAWVLWQLGQDILRSERSAEVTPETVATAA